ncbi:MAG: PEGA domain-containing protein [Ignavibacteriales bacterium]
MQANIIVNMERVSGKIKLFSLFLLTIFSFSCDKKVSVTAPEEPVPQTYIFINSLPGKAAIFLDGKNTGRITPDSLCWIKPAEHNITLKLQNYKDTVLTVQAVSNEKKSIFVDYLKNPSMYGSIACGGSPKLSKIFLNGKNTGKLTPDTLRMLIPGKYEIKYQAEGCREDSLIVTVQSSKISDVLIELADTTLWVTYNTANSKIPTGSLTKIVVDDHDNKWIGTNGKGLIKYNGIEWVTYNSSNSPLPGEIISCMAVEKGKKLWIGTYIGLAAFDGFSWEVYNTGNSIIPDNRITSIDISADGNKLIGTTKGIIEISKYKGDPWKLYNEKTCRMADDYVMQVAYADGNIWAGTLDSGLCYLDAYKNWHSLNFKNGLPGYFVKAMKYNPFVRKIWAYFSPEHVPGGLVEGTNVSYFQWSPVVKTLPLNGINSITINQYYSWISSSSGIMRIDNYAPRTSTVYSDSNSPLPTNDIQDIAVDSNGILWITTSGYGLVKFKMPR